MSRSPRSASATSSARLRPVLETIPLLAGLEQEVVARIAAVASMRRVAPNTVVIEQGDPAHTLFAVSTGKLKVVAPRQGGRPATLHILGPGDVFGEVAMFHPSGRTARVTALEHAVLLALDKAVFLDLLTRAPVLSQRLLSLMACRLRDTIAHFDINSTLDVPQRLARKLLTLANDFGVPEEGGIGLDVRLSQRELGELIDSTRQTVNQHLQQLRKAGVICIRSGRVVILDLEALRNAASPA